MLVDLGLRGACLAQTPTAAELRAVEAAAHERLCAGLAEAAATPSLRLELGCPFGEAEAAKLRNRCDKAEAAGWAYLDRACIEIGYGAAEARVGR